MVLTNVQELLGTGAGTEGQLLIPRKIHDVIIGSADKALIPRSEAAMYFGPGQIPGSSIDIDLETPNQMDVRKVAEGAEIWLDQNVPTSINLKPEKYGVSIRITKELMEDSKWNLLQQNIQTAGKRFAENENSLVISDALDQAAATTAGGTSVAISDLTESMQDLEENDYEATTLFVGTEVVNDLRNIDTFVEADKVGNTDMLKRGFLGVIYGMNVIRVSTNAGMTKTTAYVTDKAHAYIIAEKRTITIENFDLPTHDMSGAAITQRLKIRHLRAAAISKITSS